jgi:Ca2+/H+ antiporter
MAVLRYTVLRALVFVVVFTGLWVIAAGHVALPLIALLALLVSAIISFFAFRREREAVAAQVAERVEQVRRRIDESTRAEDDG